LNSGNRLPEPHGGKLIERVDTSNVNFDGMYSTEVSIDLRNDIENIADGIFSPLEGFVGQDEFENIVKFGRLKNDLAWTIPITLDVDRQTAMNMKDAKEVILRTGNDHFGIIYVEEIYSFNKTYMMESIYQTTDVKHPGVIKVTNMKDWLVGGKIKVIKRIPQSPLRIYRRVPSVTRSEIARNGWKTVVGFQTRNVPHVAHEMLQKAALNIFDGLFVNPLIGKKKPGDYKDEVILAAY